MVKMDGNTFLWCNSCEELKFECAAEVSGTASVVREGGEWHVIRQDEEVHGTTCFNCGDTLKELTREQLVRPGASGIMRELRTEGYGIVLVNNMENFITTLAHLTKALEMRSISISEYVDMIRDLIYREEES